MTTHSAKAKSHKKAKGFIMTNRDKAILLLVYLYRALSNLQIYLLLFQGRDRTRGTERTKGLCENGYLEEVKQYILEGKGKNPTVYTLTQLGAELIGAEDWSPKDSLFKPLFLNHLLRTNDVRIAITLAVQACGGELRGWMDERELGRKLRDDPIQLPTEPKPTTLNPDGYFVLSVPEIDIGIYGFLEVDMGTESNTKTWTRKIICYLEYYQHHYKRRFGSGQMRVFTVTTSETRLKNLKTTTELVGGRKRFWFTTFERIKERDILNDSLWSVATDDELHPMTD